MLPVMRRAIAFPLLLLAAAGCGGDEQAAPSTSGPAPAWTGLPFPRPADGTLPVEEFRAYAAAVDAAWEADPVALAREYLQLDGGVATVTGSRVTVLRDGLEDDSVRAERFVLDLERDGDRWTLASARWTQRCHDGRGHQDFTPELCV